MLKKILLILLNISVIAFGQFQHGDFETWSDNINPSGWGTNNFEGFWIPITQSNDSYSGSFAANLEILSYQGNPIFPSMTTYAKVDQQYPVLNGFYKLNPSSSNEGYLIIYVYPIKGNGSFGSGEIELADPASSYTPFSLEITYYDDSVPDSVWILVNLVSDNDEDPAIGTAVLLDGLNFGTTTDLKETGQIHNEFSLKQNYPNPFNPTTTISYTIPSSALVNNGANQTNEKTKTNSYSYGENVSLIVYDLLGRKIKTLINKKQNPGNYSIQFDGNGLASGIYYYKLQSGNFLETKKMILLK